MIKKPMMFGMIASLWSFGLILIWTQNPLLQGFLFILVTTLSIVTALTLNERYQKRETWHQEQLEYRLSKTQEAEEKTHEQLDTLVETLSSGFMLLDYEGVFTMANKAARDLLQKLTVKQETIQDLKASKPLYEAIYQSFIAEKPQRHQVRLGDLTYDIQTSPLFQAKLFMGLIVIMSDITQLKRAEQFQKQFTADVTHELKTPLSAILGSAELMLRHTHMTKSEHDEFLDTIFKEAKRLETLIADLLIISKMDRIDYELKKTTVSMPDLIKECTETSQSWFANKGLAFTELSEAADLLIDKDKVRQVILNLLRNAAHYTDQGSVQLKGYIEGAFYRIDVSDTGIGIAKSEHENIFKRFYRVDEARSRDSGGSGLGLSIIKNVVLKHQGKIEVTSERAQGSTFSVWFPLPAPSHR